jgi:hypothetical protein
MGAGASYTIEFEDMYADSIKINSVNISEDGQTAIVDCEIALTGSVKATSYMYGCGWINDCSIICRNITVESTYDDPITEEDVRDAIENGSWNADGIYGGGWIHSTFDGEVEVDVDSDFYGNAFVNKATYQIVDGDVIDFIDKAVLGENVEYFAWYNGQQLGSYSTEDDAIREVKYYINEQISDGTPDNVDFAECWVESEYWYLTNESGDIDYDNDPEVVWTADGDRDYEDYIDW